jgi:Ser/Thr protein kinase RdoA (MazF antagonist)
MGESRKNQVHRFLNHLVERGVRTPLPIPTLSGASYAVDRDGGEILELYAFIEGDIPDVGDMDDTRVVATALAAFHNAGTDFHDLPDEESCDQNHVSLLRLRRDMQRARSASTGKRFAGLLREYLDGSVELVASLERLRGRLVETGLHCDASPANILLTEDGEVWFLDCDHAVRGCRVFDVVTAQYYFDPVCDTAIGDPRRYAEQDVELQTTFEEAYQAVCRPVWSDAETMACVLEQALMLVHGATYWALECSADDALMELTGFRELWHSAMSRARDVMSGL